MRKISQSLAQFFSHYLPDALSFCLILSVFVFAAALIFTPSTSIQILSFWGDSLWNLHTFAMQMVLILLFGHLLAQSPFIKKNLARLAALPKSETGAILFLVFLSSLACWLNWGFGLIVAATLAISIKERFPHLHFGFLVASGYAGFLVWHGGLSGSIPLSVAGDDKILAALALPVMPLGQTIFSLTNIILVITLILVLMISAVFLKTHSPENIQILKIQAKPSGLNLSISDKIQSSPWVLRGAGLVGLIYLGLYFYQNGSFHINSVNFILFMLVFISYGSIYSFTRELEGSVRVVAPILIQYPLYAGIMGMIQSSSLALVMSEFFVGISSPGTFPLFTFLSAGIVNFFVPSGGGQWIIQGPIMLKAALNLGVPAEKVVMAIAWGDAWTNMIQPFWALPLLSMARMNLKDIMSFCLIYLIVSGIVISSFMLI